MPMYIRYVSVMFLEYNKQKLYYFIFEDLIYQYLTIMTPKVVIIGGSYAGLAALNTLKLLITKIQGPLPSLYLSH